MGEKNQNFTECKNWIEKDHVVIKDKQQYFLRLLDSVMGGHLPSVLAGVGKAERWCKVSAKT